MSIVFEQTKKQSPPKRTTYDESQNAQAFPSRTIVHAKLEMTEPGDQDEQEANTVANAVVSGEKISRKISGSAGSSSGIAVSQQMESQLSQLKGGGRQMPDGLRSMMESGFGQDFSSVRLHTDSDAASMSSSIQAKAFTHGNDIYFNQGQFSPETAEGQRLVAHELTHVAQGNERVAREVSSKTKYQAKKAGVELNIIFFLIRNGFNKIQICAILGNWQHESNLDPLAVEGVIYYGQKRIDNYMVWTEDREKGSKKTLEQIYKNSPKVRKNLSQPKALAGGGIGQWTGNRAARLEAFANSQGKDKHDLQLQLDFALHENRNNSFDPKAWAHITSLEKAVVFFMNKFEGLKAYHHSKKDRLAHANSFLNRHGHLIDMFIEKRDNHVEQNS